MIDFPKISLITVCYNSEQTIEKTFKSIIHQQYSNLEYIVVDGASTDSTLNIIKTYQEYIDKLVSEPDNGIYDAINKGINLATGDIIGIVNSDDYLSTNTLHEVAHTFYSNNNIDVIYGNLKIIKPKNSLEYILKPSLPLNKNKFKGMPMPHPAVYITKKCYKEMGGYSLDYNISSDYEFILRLIQDNKKFLYLDKVLSNMLDGGVSSNNFLKSLQESLLIKRRYGCNFIVAYNYFFIELIKNFIIHTLRNHSAFNKIYKLYKNKH
jgi:glycosyltransferase involved in cell wall biosynthesis